MRRKRQAEENWHRRNRDLDKAASAHRGINSSPPSVAREGQSGLSSIGQCPPALHDDSGNSDTCSTRERSRSPSRGAAARAEW